jgi:hypothetical protein
MTLAKRHDLPRIRGLWKGWRCWRVRWIETGALYINPENPWRHGWYNSTGNARRGIRNLERFHPELKGKLEIVEVCRIDV